MSTRTTYVPDGTTLMNIFVDEIRASLSVANDVNVVPDMESTIRRHATRDSRLQVIKLGDNEFRVTDGIEAHHVRVSDHPQGQLSEHSGVVPASATDVWPSAEKIEAEKRRVLAESAAKVALSNAFLNGQPLDDRPGFDEAFDRLARAH